MSVERRPWKARLRVQSSCGAETPQSAMNIGSLRILALACLLAGAGAAQPSGFTPIDPWDQISAMRRGVNIIGYDPLWKDFAAARFQERHFRRIHEAGLQTVRINLQAFRHMDAANRLSAAWFKTLDWAVKGALAQDLTVILDEHDFTACGNNAEACRPRLMAFWEQVADHYKDAPNRVLFEILNEPNSQVTPDIWNAWLNEALAIIRKTNPRRNVVIGPAAWNNIFFLDKMELPAADRHIVATVHYYLPMN